MCLDALDRGTESCGGHFREEYQTPEGEALRNDEDFCHVALLGVSGVGQDLRYCTRSPWNSNPSIWPKGVTNNATDITRLASEERHR